MSISAIGQSSPLAALLPGGAAAPTDKPASPAEIAAAKAAAAKAKDKATLDAIRDKGIYQWAKEQQLEKLKEKIRAQVLAARGTSEGDLAKLDPKQRAATESSIEEEIARRIKEAMLDVLEHQAKSNQGGKDAPAIIDIKV